MKKVVGLVVGIVVGGSLVWMGMRVQVTEKILPAPSPTAVPTPLYKYSIEQLNQAPEGKLHINGQNFEFEIGGLGKKTSGQIRIPEGHGKSPVIVMWRGYIDQGTYQTGMGTQWAAEQYAKAGFITIAPDFLGYGQSDPQSVDIFEARFQTYWTAISLLKSVGQIDQWDGKNIEMWGHSNGGQIALVVLEATGKPIPTVLWAPVSKGFPYSVLVFTDEATDGGKFIRKNLSEFEKIYDSDKFAVNKYLDKINAPLQIHQGTSDVDVPVWWSDQMVKIIKMARDEDAEDITYYKYQGDDHNLRGNWETVVQRDIMWFKSAVGK